MPIAFHLTYFIKESQLQHGLRAEDFARYHHYLTNRLATLRSQLNLSNDKKRFLRKEVTAHNATDPRHFMLLALYAERCYAVAEAIEERRQAVQGNQTEMNLPSGGIAPHDLYRKKLNKAVKWAAKLNSIAKEVGVEELRFACAAYEHETRGRAELSHNKFASAKRSFTEARANYCAEFNAISSEELNIRDAVRMKVNEMSDRVIYCMQHLGENVSTYAPPPLFAGPSQATFSSDVTVASANSAVNEMNEVHDIATLNWNGRRLNVTSMKVRDALREVNSIPSELTTRKVLESTSVITLGQMNKVLELLDRRINYYNDALNHARHDLRNSGDGTAEKTSLQLLEHYLLYHVSDETVERALFLVEVYSRRFDSTERLLESSAGKKIRKAELPSTQFASPLEVVHLYKMAAEELEKMELLPGVSGQVEISSLMTLCEVGKLIYTAEAWRVAQRNDSALNCYTAALELLTSSSETFSLLRQQLSRSSDNTTSSLVTNTMDQRNKNSKTLSTISSTTVTNEKSNNNYGNSNKLNSILTRLAQLRDRAECAMMRMRAQELLLQEQEEQQEQQEQVYKWEETEAGKILVNTVSAAEKSVYLTDLIAHDVQKVSDGTSSSCSSNNKSKQTEKSEHDKVITPVTVAQNVIRFPPPYQLVSCKPTCIDVASTFIQFKTNELSTSQSEAATTNKNILKKALFPSKKDDKLTESSANALKTETKSAEKESAKSWGWRWAWGKKESINENYNTNKNN